MNYALYVWMIAKEKRAHSSVGIHFIPNAYSHGLKKTTIAHAVALKFQK
tara:strand:- start:1022 stop:1168 length:147 start_codon:yes stop_codon:yes gene_type:complete